MEIILSACMIVRDEEANLARCLDSIHELVDEIIVVDTGSVDATMDIAKSYEKVKLFEQPWENDFSFHRNYSISLAGGKWLLIVDADEQLAPMEASSKEFKEKLKKIKEPINALIVNCMERTEVGNEAYTWDSIRIFRNGVGFHYADPVHNRPRFEGYSAQTDILLYHYGYHLPKEEMKKKEQRQFSMISKQLEKNPDEHRWLYYMCQALLAADKYEEGIEYGLKCIEKLNTIITDPKQLEFYAVLYYSCGMACIKLNRPDDAYAWLKKAIEILPDHIDFHFGMGYLAYYCNRDDLLEEAIKNYWDLLPNYIHGVEWGPKFGIGSVKRMPSAIGIYSTTDHAQRLVKKWMEVTGIEVDGISL